MSFEAKRCRHVAVAIPEVRVSRGIAVSLVLVSSTLRDLVIGSGLEFEEHGAHELKGVPEEWRLFAVASA
jgi:class 3 adenylate cyclase